MFGQQFGQINDRVALLAEGVDRNDYFTGCLPAPQVALLAEGVDRNTSIVLTFAWKVSVSLLAEGVDRNSNMLYMARPTSCRLPRGGRG